MNGHATRYKSDGVRWRVGPAALVIAAVVVVTAARPPAAWAGPGEAAGDRAAVEVEVERPGALTRYTLDAAEAAADGTAVTLHFNVQDGAIRQAWAVFENGSRVNGVDASRLQLVDGGLRGPIEMSYQRPGRLKTRLARLEVSARREGDALTGTLRGMTAERGRLLIPDKPIVERHELRYAMGGPTEGAVRGRLAAAARDQGRVRATFERVMSFQDTGGQPLRFGRSDMLAVFEDGELIELKITPRRKDMWTGRLAEGSDLRIEGDRIIGTMVIETTGRWAGTYRVEADLKLVGNHATGGFESRRDGKKVNRESGMHGVLESTGRRGGTRERGVLVLTLDEAFRGESALDVQIDVRDGRFGDGSVNIKGTADASGLAWDGDRLRGPLKLVLPETTGLITPGSRDAEPTYQIDARLEGGRLEGRYTGVWGEPEQIDLAITGRVTDGDRLREAERLAEGSDWPCWIGPQQDFSATPRGHALVGDLAEARVVWWSEQTPPGRLQNFRYAENNLAMLAQSGMPAGGCASPIVYAGRVYLNYVRPADRTYEQDILDSYAERGIRTVKALWARRNDDVVLCIDAATGQTVWKAVIPNRGVYLFNPFRHGSMKRGPFTSFLSAGNGRVFYRSSTGHTLCLDAAQGDLLWSTGDRGGELSRVIDGVVIMVNADGTTIGLDVATGERRWALPETGDITTMPLEWQHGDKTYAIIGGTNARGEGRSRLTCLVPRTGQVVWQVDDLGQASAITLTADHLTIDSADAAGGEGDGSRFTVYRLTLDGPRKAWSLDRPHVYTAHRNQPTGFGDTILAGFPKRLDRAIAFDAATGRVRAETGYPYGKFAASQLMEDLWLLQDDTSHNHTPFIPFRVSRDTVRQTGERWNPPHFETSGYSPVCMTHPMVDGRLIIRGGRHVVCYDLRKPAGH